MAGGTLGLSSSSSCPCLLWQATLERFDLLSLQLGTFRAEPVNKAVHAFAQRHLMPNYINSYWATEHGGIVWSRVPGNDAQPVRADTRSWLLPWIDGDVLISDGEGGWRRAADGEHGEVVIRQRYPYTGLTVWCTEGFGTAGWHGDVNRWARYFPSGGEYVQGDTAVRHEGGAYTIHGRSDEVINVGGNRIGTEEIESALLADTERPAGSPLRNVAVVDMPDEVLGTRPVAFVVLQPGGSLQASDEGRLRSLVQSRLSSVAVPAKFIVAVALPETYSGKFMRRLLQARAFRSSHAAQQAAHKERRQPLTATPKHFGPPPRTRRHAHGSTHTHHARFDSAGDACRRADGRPGRSEEPRVRGAAAACGARSARAACHAARAGAHDGVRGAAGPHSRRADRAQRTADGAGHRLADLGELRQ